MMTPKDELILAIQHSSDRIVRDLLEVLKALQHQQLSETAAEQPARQKTVLERMGGVPKHLLSDGSLSDRDRRRTLILGYLHQKYRRSS